jgi:CheY-specific phosphatase CheX
MRGDVMAERVQSLFNRSLIEAVSELLPSYGTSLISCEDSDPPHSEVSAVAGIIGFTSPRFGGVLAVQTSAELVATTVPSAVRSGSVSQKVVLDWIAELANQLLGRIKNKMIRYDGGYAMSPPTSVIGNDLNVTAADADATTWKRLETPAGRIYVMVDFRADREVLLSATDDEAHTAAAEGDLMLF